MPDECIEFLGMEETETRDILIDHNKSRKIGSGWIASKLSVALAVPSVHIHPLAWLEEPNVLINPLHSDFSKVRMTASFRSGTGSAWPILIDAKTAVVQAKTH